MKRLAALVLLVAALSVAALVGRAAPAAADCSINGNYETCQYLNVAFLGSGATYYSRYMYWYTNKMWRDAPAWADIAFQNGSGYYNGYVSRYYDNPVVTRGSYGYDRAWCENTDSITETTVTCQVYNWNA